MIYKVNFDFYKGIKNTNIKTCFLVFLKHLFLNPVSLVISFCVYLFEIFVFLTFFYYLCQMFLCVYGKL